MEKHRAHGLFSLIFLSIAFVTAIATFILNGYEIVGMVYLGIIIFCVLLVVRFFCSKCMCGAKKCSHLFIGALTAFFKDRKGEDYKMADIVITMFCLAVLFLFPQYWLWSFTVPAIIFITMSMVGILEILLFVCRGCENEKCPLGQRIYPAE